MTLSAPEPIGPSHDIAAFASGEPALDAWLKRRAMTNQAAGATRTFVVCEGARVVGYHALASGSVTLEAASGRFRRNMPEPIPVIVLARLAVDQAWQGRGLGRGLFRDAGLRVTQAAELVGVRGLIVHAISDEAQAFYLALGLTPSPLDPLTLMITLDDLRRALG